MLQFQKGREPEGLVIARSTPGAVWDGPPSGFDKQAVREAVVRDQDGLCAYCQRRIAAVHRAQSTVPASTDRSTRIEHWHARAAGGGHFEWSNLLGVCIGAVLDLDHRPPGPPRVVETCDRARGARPLFLHPAEGHGPNPRTFLRFLGSGRIETEDARAAADLETLNLNAWHLQRGRRAALDALKVRIGQDWTAGHLRREREKVRSTEHREFAWAFIDRWLRRWA